MHPILKKYNEVNAFGRLIGIELEVIEPGVVQYTMQIDDKHLSNPFAAHGGAVAAMMDGILGVAAMSLAAERLQIVSTVEFKLNFYAPVQKGDILLGEGRVVFEGKRILSAEGTIFCKNRDMEVVCKGLGTFNAYPLEKHPFLSKEV